MNDDTISRQSAIDALERTKEKDPKGDIASFYNTITDNKIAVIEALPSAQPEIIRCKDCIYFDKGYDEDTANWCHAWSETTSEDGYCHNAERGEV